MKGVTTSSEEERLTDAAEALVTRRVDRKFKSYFAWFAVAASLGVVSFLATLKGSIQNHIVAGVSDETEHARNQTLEALVKARIRAEGDKVEIESNLTEATNTNVEIQRMLEKLSRELDDSEANSERLAEVSSNIDALFNEVKDFTDGDTAKSIQVLGSIAEGLEGDDAAVRLLGVERSLEVLQERADSLPGLIANNNWISADLKNGWTPYGSSYLPPRYTRDSAGIVHVAGLAKSGVLSKPIFTLPPGMRPSGRLIFSALTDPNATSRVDIDSSGNVIPMNGSPSWISLAGISFVSEQ